MLQQNDSNDELLLCLSSFAIIVFIIGISRPVVILVVIIANDMIIKASKLRVRLGMAAAAAAAEENGCSWDEA